MNFTHIVARLRLKHLNLFQHVAEQQNLRRAAQLSHMTQPAATKLIAELEDIVGGKLFLRDRKGMKLTLEGELMSRHVKVLVADMERMASELALARAGAQGHIRLGVLPSLAPGLLTRSIGKMLKAHPRVRFTIREEATHLLLDAVERNELDMAFARVQDRARATGLRRVEIYSESFAIVARKGHPLAALARRRLWQELSNASWVLAEAGTPLRAMVETLFRSHGALQPAPAVECSTLDKVADLVAGSDMVGVLPQSLAQHGDRAKKLMLVHEGIQLSPTNLVWRAQEQPPAVMQEFVAMARQAVEELGLA